MIETTKPIKKVIIRDNILKIIYHRELYNTFREKLNRMYSVLESKYFSAKWIKFAFNGEIGYWNNKTFLAVPVQTKYQRLKEKYFGIERTEISDFEVKALFNKQCPEEIMQGINASKNRFSKHWIMYNAGSYCIESKEFASWIDGDSIRVGVVGITPENFKKAILSQMYAILTDDVFKNVVKMLNDRSIIETNDKTKCITEQEIDSLVEFFELDRNKIEKEVSEQVMSNYTMSPELLKIYTESLLACDRTRADLENYDKKCLEDVNSGHWELWYDNEPKAGNDQVLAVIEKPLIARNPVADIHEDGLIGIDFGTKSTIVSKRDGREKTSLLRVGTGQLNKKAEAYHYENPTIMEFINLEKFLSDYNARNGRPDTSIDDLRVSHTANNDLKSCTVSDDFYSYFYDIKQWCGDTDRSVKIIDQKGVERVLPAFISLGKDDFNPLEIYAYYLGLYINNMRNGIYLDYILSFPVTYEKSVKEKILESFTKGLKKSLPETILNNEEIMAKFRVRQGVSEPAAYAITALQGYGFEPDEDENIFYSIFDFGGGTTDFDFGLWRCADESKRDERRYDYVIEHFGSEGDKYLGGENLLELMAYEVFKANADLLGRTKKSDKDNDEKSTSGFSFSKPKECDDFPGSETLISDSQEARRNTKQLMEVLRPFWEGIIGIYDESYGRTEEQGNVTEKNDTIAYNGYVFKNTDKCRFPINDGAIKVDLFDKDGNRKSGQKLFVENKEKGININLVDILEKRIERGVSNFFTSIYLAFRNESAVKSRVNEIQIFLAGNSSKSPILRKLFDKYIEDSNNEFREKSDRGYFRLFPPLGTKEAAALQHELGMKTNENDITTPTGKTGVAYGLIAGRDGGKIKIISETKADKQTKFRYNVGISKRGKFKIILDRNKIDYGQWIYLIDAGIEDFEIYYTSLPNAAKMLVEETGIYNKRCRLPFTDENADVYIRCVEDAPEDIEYCVSRSDEPSEDTEIIRIHLDC